MKHIKKKEIGGEGKRKEKKKKEKQRKKNKKTFFFFQKLQTKLKLRIVLHLAERLHHVDGFCFARGFLHRWVLFFLGCGLVSSWGSVRMSWVEG